MNFSEEEKDFLSYVKDQQTFKDSVTNFLLDEFIRKGERIILHRDIMQFRKKSFHEEETIRSAVAQINSKLPDGYKVQTDTHYGSACYGLTSPGYPLEQLQKDVQKKLIKIFDEGDFETKDIKFDQLDLEIEGNSFTFEFIEFVGFATDRSISEYPFLIRVTHDNQSYTTFCPVNYGRVIAHIIKNDGYIDYACFNDKSAREIQYFVEKSNITLQKLKMPKTPHIKGFGCGVGFLNREHLVFLEWCQSTLESRYIENIWFHNVLEPDHNGIQTTKMNYSVIDGTKAQMSPRPHSLSYHSTRDRSPITLADPKVKSPTIEVSLPYIFRIKSYYRNTKKHHVDVQRVLYVPISEKELETLKKVADRNFTIKSDGEGVYLKNSITSIKKRLKKYYPDLIFESGMSFNIVNVEQ